MPLTDAQAQAVTEVAKTSGKVVDVAGGVGTFLGEPAVPCQVAGCRPPGRLSGEAWPDLANF